MRGIRSVSETVDVPRLNPDGTPVRNANGDPIVDKVPKYPVGTTGLWVNPFNPCYPDTDSRSCDRVRPIGQELDHRGPGGQEPVAGPEWPAAAEPPDRAPALTQGRISSATPASSGRRAFGGRTSPPGGLPVV